MKSMKVLVVFALVALCVTANVVQPKAPELGNVVGKVEVKNVVGKDAAAKQFISFINWPEVKKCIEEALKDKGLTNCVTCIEDDKSCDSSCTSIDSACLECLVGLVKTCYQCGVSIEDLYEIFKTCTKQ